MTPRMRGYKMRCCDCGLVHRLDFEVIKHGRGYKVRFRAWRDTRSTGQVRRAFEQIRVIKAKKP